MNVRSFTRVFSQFPLLSDTLTQELETTFLDPTWGFLWDVSQRNVKVMDEFIDDITQFDFGLKAGDVVSVMTSLGTRMIAIGTPLGNVVIHERQRYRRVEERDEDGSGPVVLIGYYPPALQGLLGTRAVKDDQLYHYTGFFNPKSNIGFTINSIVAELIEMA